MKKNYLNQNFGIHGFFLLRCFYFSGNSFGQVATQTYTSGTGTFIVPAGVTTLNVQAWGAGGAGGGAVRSFIGGSNSRGGGGGGGGLRNNNSLSVSPNQTYTVTIGNGPAGTSSTGSNGEILQ